MVASGAFRGPKFVLQGPTKVFIFLYVHLFFFKLSLRHLYGLEGVSIGGRQLNNIQYADDTVLMATSSENIETLLDVVVEESEG